MMPNVRTLFFFESRLRFGWRAIILLALWLGLSGGIYFALGSANILFVYILLVAVTWFVLKFIDNRSLLSIGLAVNKKVLVTSATGLGMGAGMLVAVWGGMYGAGIISVSAAPAHADVLSYDIAIFFVAAFGEELLFRGYIFQHFVEATSEKVAVPVCATLFALLHASNPGVHPLALANVFLAGVWLSLAFLRWRSLWVVTALHFGWNVTQGSIVGLPVSGGKFSSLLKSTVDTNAPFFLSGGAFGAEGNVFTTTVLLCVIILLYKKWKMS